MKIISGSSNQVLSENIAQSLNIPLAKTEISKFANGEKRVWIQEDVQGEDVILLQSFSHPVDENIVEALLLLDALERANAKKVIVIIPWLGYSLQDKVFRPGEPIATKVIANILSGSYVNKIFLLDLHNNSIPGFFSVPTNHISAIDLFAEYVKNNFDLSTAIIGSPDFGGLKRARVFADKLGLDLINIEKQRNLSTGEVKIADLHGNVENKDVILFDDVVVSGSTVIEASSALKKSGAKSVHFMTTHGLFTDNAVKKIQNSEIDSLIITNSIHHQSLNNKIKVLDIAPIFVEALRKWI